MKKEIICKDLSQTYQLAQKIASCLSRGDVLTMNGNLGAGKTSFAQGVALGLGVKDKVNSPTFNILKCYFDGRLPFYHIDAYRLEDKVNNNIGLEEVIEGDGVCLIEWGIYIPNLIYNNLDVNIEILQDGSRKYIFDSDLKRYRKVFDLLEEFYNV